MNKFTVVGVLCLVLALAIVATACAQGGFGGPPGGGRPGGPPGDMGALTYLEKSWTAVCFQLSCTDEQQAALRDTYASELKTRDTAIAQARKSRDMTAMMKACETTKTNLKAKLTEVLTDEQQATLEQLMQASEPQPPPR